MTGFKNSQGQMFKGLSFWRWYLAYEMMCFRVICHRHHNVANSF